MKILYKSKKLEKTFSSLSRMQAAYGQLSKRLDRRMQQISQAVNLKDIKALPSARLHQLKGKDAGSFAVNISGNWRLVFSSIDGDLEDYTTITIVRVEKVVDYH